MLDSLWMYPMNRCNSVATLTPPFSLKFPALPLLVLALAASAAIAPRVALAQDEPTLQAEAALGGRNFPVGTLRGSFVMVGAPDILLDGQADRLSAGARIRNPQNMLLTPASIIGQKLLVNYTRDPSGLVLDVWVLTPVEARAQRASVERPLLNFWPFVASTGPRDDGKTPFDQLPKFGQ